MYILITGECEVIGCETKVEVFATKEDAHSAMVRDAKARALDAGIPKEEFSDYIDNIGDDGGYILDVVGWQIRELPGLLIPDGVGKNVSKMIDDAQEMYADKTLADWYDADDLCIEACNEIRKYL